MEKIFKIDPFPAVRSNKNSWSKKVQDYHSKMNHLRLLVWDDRKEIIKALIDWYYVLNFIIPMPKSWSKKKKEKYNWMPHQQTPDTDNLFKAFTDTLFYKVKEIDWKKINDSQIWDLWGRKYWWEEWKIIFNN